MVPVTPVLQDVADYAQRSSAFRLMQREESKMDLRVDDAAMKSLVAKAIVDSLTDEMRQKLISDAVAACLTVSDGAGYGRKRSPLQQAFDTAVENEARNYARELLSNDAAFKAQIQALFAGVARKLFETETRDKLVESLADAIASALRKDRY